MLSSYFFFNDTATTEIYTLSLHDALPISFSPARLDLKRIELKDGTVLEPPAKDPGAKPSVFESAWSRIVRFESSPKEDRKSTRLNSSHSQISYAVFCLKKKKNKKNKHLYH